MPRKIQQCVQCKKQIISELSTSSIRSTTVSLVKPSTQNFVPIIIDSLNDNNSDNNRPTQVQSLHNASSIGGTSTSNSIIHLDVKIPSAKKYDINKNIGNKNDSEKENKNAIRTDSRISTMNSNLCQSCRMIQVRTASTGGNGSIVGNDNTVRKQMSIQESIQQKLSSSSPVSISKPVHKNDIVNDYSEYTTSSIGTSSRKKLQHMYMNESIKVRSSTPLKSPSKQNNDNLCIKQNDVCLNLFNDTTTTSNTTSRIPVTSTPSIVIAAKNDTCNSNDNDNDSIVEFENTDDEDDDNDQLWNQPLAKLFVLPSTIANGTVTIGTSSTSTGTMSQVIPDKQPIVTTSCPDVSINPCEDKTIVTDKSNTVTTHTITNSKINNSNKVLQQTTVIQNVLEPNKNIYTNRALRMCFVCGKDLTAPLWKNRLLHIKKCSVKHGVSMKDVHPFVAEDEMFDLDNDDDEEDFIEIVESCTTTAIAIPQTSQTTNSVAVASSSSIMFNPYNKKLKHMQTEWHGSKNTSTASKASDVLRDNANDATVDRSIDATKRSLNDILMAGARKVASVAKQSAVQKVTSNSSTVPTNVVPEQLFTTTNGYNSNNQSQSRPYNNNRFGNKYNRTTNGTANRRSAPSYKKIPQTDFICDGFYYANECVTKNYFLTHFHSDHYGGIDKSWKAGTIYCSTITAKLVNQQLGVDRQYIHPLPMYTPTTIISNAQTNTSCKTVTVTLLNANHCPGAIMFLFEIGNRSILHVGDFRWNTCKMLQQLRLKPFCTGQRQLDDLYLDTTYCDSRYDFPTQEECIDEAVTTAVSEWDNSIKNNIRILMIFGAYTIGKEAVYLAVAKKLQKKIYVDPYRLRVVKALEWTNEEMSLFTTNINETNLWVVPLGHINIKNISTMYLSGEKRGMKYQYDKVIGFRPTGWSHTKTNKKKNTKSTPSLSSFVLTNNDDDSDSDNDNDTTGAEKQVKRRKISTRTETKKPSKIVTTVTRGNTITIHSVPYSEHSSFTELVECIEHLQPKRIVPTVSVSKTQQQIALLLQSVQESKDNKKLIGNLK